MPIALDKTTLAPGESATGTYVYTVTQADIDAGLPLVNVVTADSNETPEDTDDETVTVKADAQLEVVKTADVTEVTEAGHPTCATPRLCSSRRPHRRGRTRSSSSRSTS